MIHAWAAVTLFFTLLSGGAYLGLYFMKLFKPESKFITRLPNWALELTLGISGVCFAVLTVALSVLVSIHPIFVYMSCFIGVVALLKVCIVVVSLIQRQEI